MRQRPWLGFFAVLLVGALTFLPAITSPFWMDDYLHVSMVDGTFPVRRGPFDLYDFVSDADRDVLMDRGILPWWTHPQFKVRFMRPLSSALLWSDHKVFGRRPLLLHLHSVAWWAAAVIAAWTLFRRAFSPRATLLGTAVFALGPCHTVPLAWLANREALVALALGAFGLVAYVRWRDERRARDAGISAVLFALAMLAGEYSLGFGGYVVAIEIVRRREAIEKRITGALPFVVPAAAYLWARAALGYGTVGSGLYRDPLGEPGSFLKVLPRRLAALLADVWSTIDADAWGRDAPWWSIGGVLVLALGLAFVVLRRVVEGLDAERKRAVAWMLLGSLFSLAPVVAVASSSRVVGVSLLGVAGVVAMVLDHAWFSPAAPAGTAAPRRGRAAELTAFTALALAFAHLVHGPITAWIGGRAIHQSATEFASRVAWVNAHVGDVAGAHIVVIRASWQTTFFAPFALDPEHASPPARWHVLTQAPGHILVLRKDARTIEVIAPRKNSIFPWGQDELFRSDDAPVHTGEEVFVAGLRVTVVDADDQGLHHVRFELDRDLDDATLAWVVENQSGFAEAPPPEAGFGVPLDP